jgi:hypothetical protein
MLRLVATDRCRSTTMFKVQGTSSSRAGSLLPLLLRLKKIRTDPPVIRNPRVAPGSGSKPRRLASSDPDRSVYVQSPAPRQDLFLRIL